MAVTDYTPTAGEVAAILRARTIVPGGQYLGTFRDETSEGADNATRPSETEAETLIAQAATEHIVVLGSEVPEGDAREAAKLLVARYAAMLIELTHFPNEIKSGKSPYAEIKELYDANRDLVIRAVNAARAAAGDDASDFGEVAAMPVNNQSKNAGGLIGWDTQF